MLVAAAAPASAQVATRTIVSAPEEGVVEVQVGVQDVLDSDVEATASAGRAERSSELPQTTVWSVDDPAAIARVVALDDANVYGAWSLQGARLSAYPIVSDGTPAFELPAFEEGSTSVATAGGADRILFMEANFDRNEHELHAFTSQSNGIPDWTFEFPPVTQGDTLDSRRLAVSYDGTTAVAILHDHDVSEYTLYVFDAGTGEVVATWTDSVVMWGVDLTDDGSLALVSQEGFATVVDTETGEVVFQTEAANGNVVHHRISGDGGAFVVAGVGLLHVYEFDGDTYSRVIEFTGPPAYSFGRGAAISRDGSTVGAFGYYIGAGDPKAEVFFFDVATGELLGSYPVSGGGTFFGWGNGAASSDDGSVMAFASWGTEFQDWPEIMVFNRDVELIGAIEFPGSAFSVDVSADGQYVVGGAKAVHANELGNGGRIELIEIELGGGELLFDPSSLDFGDVEVGTTSPPQTTMLQNTGDADATGLSFSGLPADGFEADTSDCGDTLPAGASCAVSVSFTPPAPGPAEAALAVESAEGGAADLSLSGNGVEAGGPIVEISPDALAFEVPQGGGDSDTLSIGNLGDADLTWSLTEAEAATPFVASGALYAYDLAWTPEFHAPVGADRASAARTPEAEAAGAPLRGALPSGPRASARPAGRTGDARQTYGRHGGRPLQESAPLPADPMVLPAPQPAAVGSLTEDFDDITQLPGAGWAMINNSEPVGPSSWFQGNDSIFPSHEGAPDAYIAANFESTDDSGDISNWLLTPEVTIVNGTAACFWTRTSEQFEEFYDRLEVRMSVEGDSTDVGDTAESVGDFTALLLSINPDLMPDEYPEEWTEFCVTVRERSRQPVTGRFAFRYWVTDSGPNGSNGDYIGIDTVSVKQPGDGAGCANPVDIPWLAADPTSGTTAPGASEPVTVTVDATGLEVGEHAARLCLTTNDPTAPLVEVPVDLTVVGETEEASFEGLGDLPGGITESWVYGVSADGSVVVGYSSSANGLSEAFRWQDGEMEGLGDLAGGDFYSRAFGISADGSVIVGHSSSSNGTEAFRWEAGTLEGLGDLEGGSFSSTANAASADGSAVAGLGISENGGEAFRWAGGGMEGLGDLPGGNFGSSAFAISADGAVVVGQSPSENGFEAFHWEDGAMEGLGDLPGGIFLSSAEAVTSDGSVVVGYSGSGDGTEACRWANGEVEGLGDLPGGAFSSFAYGVSADGSVVIGHSSTADGNQAFIWTETDGMRSLQEVLEEDYGLDLTGWVLWTARGISDDGTVIVGHGENPNGDTEGWRAFLGEPTVLTWRRNG